MKISRLHQLTLVAFAMWLSSALPVAAQTAAPAPSAPSAAAPGVSVPLDYLIGPEDVLGVVFWRDTDMSGDVTVRPDGRITLPLIGDLQAAGSRPDVLREQIQKAADKYLSDANVTVVVRQINSRKVFITGQVVKPGPYVIAAPTTVLQLIAMAGGLKDFADSKNITIVRHEAGQTSSHVFNYKEIRKNVRQNIELKPGDTVVVP
jgi:polysaccharide biosynthesis/export protein